MTHQKVPIGKIIIPPDINIWPHEHQTARALAMSGYTVQFIRKSNKEREHSADCYIDDVKWELKSPNAHHLKTIRKNLKKACTQSRQVVLDSNRIKGIPDQAILREVKQQVNKIKYLDAVKYINKRRQVIDIK